MFCPKCGSLLRPKMEKGKKVAACSCGYSSEKTNNAALSEKVKSKEIEVIDEEVEAKPIVDTTCEKCGHNKAYFWSIQTRASDEPETRFFKCVECKNTWREYK